MDCKKQKISAVRDFPKGCGEQGRAIANTLNNLLEAGWELGMLYDSESVVTSAVASGEHRGTDMTKSLNLEGLSGPLQTLKHEATELSKKAVTRVYPSRRRTSGTRHFPEGCARKTSQSVNEVVWESNPSKANGLENAISCVEDISAEVRIKRDTQKSEAAVGILAKRGIAATRCFPDDYREEALGSKPNGSISECGRVTQGSKPSGSIRECGRMIRSHGSILTDWDRVIVMGLMASHKCPWRQGKGAQKPAGNTGVTMGKDTSRGRQISSTMRKGKVL